MGFEVQFSADAENDFGLIFDFLVESYLAFGENVETAIEHATIRVEQIRQDAESIGGAPFRGTLHDEISPGLRHVTMNRAIIWFDILPDTDLVRILAIFFGGQDHQRKMLVRLLS